MPYIAIVPTRVHKFVFAVAGQDHVAEVNRGLAYLKRFTKREIVVLSVRADGIRHNNVKKVLLPDYSDFLASRYLKINVFNILKSRGTFCYLDNDVYAVDQVDGIFREFHSPVTFATDHVSTVSKFSKWALTQGSLDEAIQEKFKVKVEADWPIWNGGVFLFNSDAEDFLNTWWRFTLAVHDDPGWQKRDQGALVAAVWRHGLQGHKRLTPEFNWIPKHTNLLLKCSDPVQKGRVIQARPGKTVKFMHFIHKGVEEDAESLTMAQTLLKMKLGKRGIKLL